MSKLAFSLGLKKSSSGRPAPGPRKPTPFGARDNDHGPVDEALSNNVLQVTALDSFGSAPPTKPDDFPKGRNKKKPIKGGDSNPPPSKPQPPPSSSSKPDQFGDLSSALTSRKYAASAEASDPSIYDYDAAYDSFKAAKAAASKSAAAAAAARRPQYFDALRQAADVRERDRQIAEERRLQRERAAEGDAFADKERFVTEAYRRQQEANRRLAEEERRREEAERERNRGRGLADFYKGMLDKGEREHAALVKAAEEGVAPPPREGGGEEEAEEEEEQDREKLAAKRAREINAMGGNVLVNEEGEVVDKRQLLKGGLNVAPKKKAQLQQEKARQAAAEAAAARNGGAAQSKGVYAAGGKQAMRERQTRMLEAQLEETLKRSRQEEKEEAAKIQLASKSRKTAAEISSAKERYLARKRAVEEAKKNGLEGVS